MNNTLILNIDAQGAAKAKQQILGVTSAISDMGQSVEELSEAEVQAQKELEAVAKERIKLAHEIAAASDVDIKDARVIVNLERERVANETKLLSLHDKQIQEQRQAIVLDQKRSALLTEQAALNNEAIKDQTRTLALARQIEAAEQQIQAQANSELASKQELIALEQKRRALGVELSAASDADLRDAKIILATEQQRVMTEAQLAAQRDAGQGAVRADLALLRQGEKIQQEIAILADEKLAADTKALAKQKELLAIEQRLESLSDAGMNGQKELLALSERRQRLAQELAAMSDADLLDTEKIIALERTKQAIETNLAAMSDADVRNNKVALGIAQDRVAMQVKMATQADAEMAAARQNLDMEQRRERAAQNVAALGDVDIQTNERIVAQLKAQVATEIKLEQLNSSQNKELALQTAKQREIAALEAKIANAQDLAVKAQQRKADAIDTERRIQAQLLAMHNANSRDLLIQEAAAKEQLLIAAKTKILADEELQQAALELNHATRLNQLKSELAELGREDIQALRGQVAFERERLEILDEIAELESGDKGFKALKEKLRLLEQERDLKNEIQSQSRLVGEGDLRDQNEKLNALQQEKALIADLEAQGRIRQGGDLEGMQNKLNAMEQETKLLADIAEAKRLADGGDLRAIQDQKVLADVVADHADEEARLNYILNNPAALQRAKHLHAMEEQLERSTRTWREKVEFVADMLEKTDSSLQVWFTLGMVAETAFKVFTEGAIARGIQEATAALGEFNSEVQISANVNGLMTKTQARQASLRGSELGLGREMQGQVAGFAATLGQRSVALGDSSDVTEATVEAMRSLQQEMRDGELGQGFKDLGVSVAQYDQAVRRAAAQKGVLPEALDRQTKQQILAAQATNDHTAALALYGNETLRSSAQVKNTFNEIKEGLGSLLAGNSPTATFGDSASKSAAGLQVARLESELAALRREAGSSQKYYGKEQIEADKSRPAWERGGGASRNDASENAEMARVEAELSAARELEMLQASAILTKQINQELELKSETILLTGAEGARQLMGLNDILKLEKQRREVGDLNSEEAQALYLETEKLLEASKLVDRAWLNQLNSRVTIKDLGRIINEQGAIQLSAAVKIADAEAKAAKHRAENTTIGTQQKRLDDARLIAAKEFEARVFKEFELQGKTFDEAQNYLNHAKVQNMIRLEGEKAINEETIKRSKFITGEQKQILETRNLVTDLKLETLGLTTNAAAYHATIGQAVAVKAFEKWGDGARTLAEQFGIGDEALGKMVQKAGELAGVVDLIAGGGLFTDKFLENLFAPTKDSKDPKGGAGKKDKGGSKSKDDDLLERLRRERIERQIEDAKRLGDVTSQAYEHQKEFIEDNLKEVSKAYQATYGDMGAIDQTMREQLARLEWQHADEMKQAGDNAKKRTAVEGALYDRIAELQKQMESRNATFFTSLEAGIAQYAQATQDGLGKVGEAWRTWETMMARQSEIAESFREDARRAPIWDSFATVGADVTGRRKESEGEKQKTREWDAMLKQREVELASQKWTVSQKLMIEQYYQSELYKIEQQYNQARFDENQRIREEQKASAMAALQETQDLMAKFSDEARSMSEGSQATFQGGLSQLGKDAATGLDYAMASGIGLIGVMENIDKISMDMKNAEKNGVSVVAKGVAGAVSAAAQAADGIVKNERWKAGIKGAVHSAESLGAYAEGNVLGGTMHALAAAKFFVIAGTANDAPAKAAKSEATKRTALSANTVALGRERGISAITQVFIQLQPITGEATVTMLNESARSGRMSGRAIDSRLTRPTATSRTEI